MYLNFQPWMNISIACNRIFRRQGTMLGPNFMSHIVEGIIIKKLTIAKCCKTITRNKELEIFNNKMSLASGDSDQGI